MKGNNRDNTRDWRKGWKEGKKKVRDRRIEGGRESNRKLLSELPMACSQSVQTLRNSRQRAGREGRCQEGGRAGGRNRARRAGRTCGLLSKETAT